MSGPKLGFEKRRLTLPLAAILPLRQVKDPVQNIRRYRTILSSIREVGLVEPLMVHPQAGANDTYLLLDGHLRFHALKELGATEVECLVATDDEGFTYNARINRLAPIQEHKMILKAVQHGVAPERIALALNRPVSHVRACMNLLEGINEEAADLLKDKGIFPKALRLLKRVTGLRQIEIAELLVSANNFTTGYTEALVLATPKDQLIEPQKPKQKSGMTPGEIARMEEEMQSLEGDLKTIENSYGVNMLNLTLARGYLRKLLDNAKVVRFFTAQCPEILAEFESIVAAETV